MAYRLRRSSGLKLPLIAAALAAGLGLIAPSAQATASPDSAPDRLLSDSVWSQESIYGSYLAGLVAEGRGDYGAAAEFLVHALSGDPENPALLQQTFMLNAAEGRMDRAYNLAERLLEQGRADAAALLLLAGQALEQDDPARARSLLADQPASGLVEITRPLLDAWLAVAQGKGEEALESLETLERDGGLSALTGLHRVLLLDVLGRDGEALEAAQTMAEVSERLSMRLVWYLGNVLERGGEAAEAEALYEAFAEQNPDNLLVERLRANSGEPEPLVADPLRGFAEALFDFASLMAQEQVPIPGLIHARLALHLAPEMEAARILIGEILQYQQRSNAALAVYEDIPEDSPFAWNAGLRMVEELQQLGDNEAAEARLRALAEARPERYEPPYRLGNLLRSQEDFEAAAEAYSEALERVGGISRQQWVLFYFRGIAHERSEQWDQAEADFLRALELEPDQPYVLNYLAYSWIEQEQNFEEAADMLERAVEREPNDGHIVDSLGWLYYRLGEYENAVEQLERAVELQPLDPVINDHLGDAYWKTGREREAVVQWRRALSLDPEDKDIPAIERKLEDGLPDEAAL
ncbi:tetratricopeptide repeat protein [Aquibaculum sediminis]|uniref:tetratricopeptide repeat protein n=1 Tax=Aquibaculum sediminis TaxID=3231907 RepID=UPI0034519900